MVPLYVTRPLGVTNDVVGGISQVYSTGSARSSAPASIRNKQTDRTIFTPLELLELKIVRRHKRNLVPSVSLLYSCRSKVRRKALTNNSSKDRRPFRNRPTAPNPSCEERVASSPPRRVRCRIDRSAPNPVDRPNCRRMLRSSLHADIPRQCRNLITSMRQVRIASLLSGTLH